MKFSYSDLRAEAERELKLRQRVYPNRIAAKRLNCEQADRQLHLQQAIIDLLRELERTELLF